MDLAQYEKEKGIGTMYDNIEDIEGDLGNIGDDEDPFALD